MSTIRLDIEMSVLGTLLEQHSLSIEDFHWVDDEGKQAVRQLFLEVTAKKINRAAQGWGN